ncbi:glycosyltransferase [Enterococcus sp. CSURQ0835]|uniref:glycosyltransferase n=1 Tax=Enterococcus sp. CSURQ0835 TaxID=2681394 RepID=UPI001358E391|nr:glycosyltransferase [Enterococcus sp. CSURQ0835]
MESSNHTFVICAYKESRYLEECIQSVLNQSRPTQVIVYTSTPNDYIQQMCDQYQLTCFSKKGGGIGKDWNNALSFVKTRYATIAHQDDLYLPEYAEKVVAEFERKEDRLIVYSDYREWKNGKVIPANENLKIKRAMLKTISVFPSWKFLRQRVLAFGNAISCPAVSYDLKNLADFRFDEKMKVSLDWKAWYDIGKRSGSFGFVDEPLMYHRIHNESETTNSIENNSRTAEDLKMYQLYWPKPVAKFLMKFYVKSQETNN